MKTLLTSIFSLVLICGYSQIDCINFGDYSDAYINTVSSDHATYPPGSTFITEGDLQLIKPNTSTFYQFISSANNEMCYVGELGIDVSAATYNCRKLTFDLVAGFWISIDGDTVIASYMDTTINSGGWSYDSDTTGGELSITIEGDFDYVEISPSTTCISNICLTSCSTGGPSCVNFSNYSDTYLNDVTADNTTYPAGSAFITEGDVQLIKPNTSSFYQFINSGNNQMCYIGWLGIDVSSASYSCRELSFELIAGFWLVVDGDSINPVYADTTVNFPAWTYDSDTTGGELSITLTGQFNYVEISQSTTCISNICLDECASSSNSCLDFTAYNNAYIQAVGMDHVTYPNGSTFMTSGDINLVKVDTTNFFPLSVDSTNQFCFIGNLGIDVSSSNFNCKKLSYSIIIPFYTAIDGDTIYGVNYDTTVYNPNWTYNSDTIAGVQYITIEGDFDYVELGNSTMCISDICLSDCSTVGLEEETAPIGEEQIDYLIYPNPTTGVLTIQTSAIVDQLLIHNMQGQLIMSSPNLEDSLDISAFENGFYFVSIVSLEGEILTQKVLKQN